jgi:hypothetical protein
MVAVSYAKKVAKHIKEGIQSMMHMLKGAPDSLDRKQVDTLRCAWGRTGFATSKAYLKLLLATNVN